MNDMLCSLWKTGRPRGMRRSSTTFSVTSISQISRSPPTALQPSRSLLTINTFCARFMMDVFWNSSTKQPLPTFYTRSMPFLSISSSLFSLSKHMNCFCWVFVLRFYHSTSLVVCSTHLCVWQTDTFFHCHLLFCFSLPGGCCSFFCNSFK